MLERTAAKIDGYADEDRELRRIAHELRSHVPQFAERVMSPMSLKRMSSVNEAMSKNRQGDGRARR